MTSCDIDDVVNRRILSVAEDQLSGFYERPFFAIAQACEMQEAEVITRLRALLRSGAVRYLRQTLPSTALSRGCLIAWKVPEDSLNAAFDWLRRHDPFTGHIVIRRSEDPAAPGADYKLWTTLKAPSHEGDMEKHCRILSERIHAQSYACMPIVGMFSLSVGHVRRAKLEPGTLLPQAPAMQTPPTFTLTEREWATLLSFRRPLADDELHPYPWGARAKALGMRNEDFAATANALVQKGALGRFAAVLDHTRRHPSLALGAGALLMWAVPPGLEQAAGSACGRHVCMTHCYWRSGAERFGGVQIMGVVHGKTKEDVLAHKAAIDSYLAKQGIDVRHTSAFHTVRAEIRPSEVNPELWHTWENTLGAASL